MKRMKKRRLLSLLLAAVMAAGLAGCAPGQIANLLLSAGPRSAQDKLSETAEGGKRTSRMKPPSPLRHRRPNPRRCRPRQRCRGCWANCLSFMTRP